MEAAKIVQMACGHFHMLALQEDGGLWAWGFNEDGRLGIGSNKSQPKPVPILPILHATSKIVNITCGGSHSMALTDEGQLFTWGRGKEGQLGHGDLKNLWRPTLVRHFSDTGKTAVQFSGGNMNSGCLTSNGRIYSWGCTRHGERVPLPKVAKGMLSAEGHSIYCGHHTVFMVMRSYVNKTSQLDYVHQKEYEVEMALFEQNLAKVNEKKHHQLSRMIAPGRLSNKGMLGTTRFCRKQASSAPVTARILSLENPVRSRQRSRLSDEHDLSRERVSAMRHRGASSGSGQPLSPSYEKFLELGNMLSKPEAGPGDKASIHSFLKATGATKNPDFYNRWAGLMQAEFGANDMSLKEFGPGITGALSTTELVQIGQVTKQFR